MTSMLEKPRSNKAETYFRYNGKRADHGTIANKRVKGQEPTDKDGAYFDKNYLQAKGVPTEDYDSMSYAQLEAAADRLLAEPYENEARNSALQDLADFEEIVTEAATGGVSEELADKLAQFVQHYKRRVELVIDKGINALDESEKAELQFLNDVLDELDDELTEMLRSEEHNPTIAETGKRTEREIRKSLARAATLDTYEDDDNGDYDGGSHIRISKSHPYDNKRL